MIKNAIQCILFLFVVVGFAPAAQTQTSQTVLWYEGEPLVLNGSGIRQVLWTDLYRCRLYLRKPSTDRETIISAEEPKVIIVDVLVDESLTEVPDPWRDILKTELTDRAFGKLKKALHKMTKGDSFSFDYKPGIGTIVRFNGKVILEDKGYGLMQALLDQWIGNDPVSTSLRDSLVSGG